MIGHIQEEHFGKDFVGNTEHLLHVTSQRGVRDILEAFLSINREEFFLLSCNVFEVQLAKLAERGEHYFEKAVI